MTETLQKVERRSVVRDLADQLKCDETKLLPMLKKTVFASCRTDEELMAMCMVAKTYHLNPMLKEIYAFPTRAGGVMPMVSVDGWLRIINEHPAFDGICFEEGDGYCTCIIYRKDRNHPTKVTEWLDECKRPTEPWKQFPRRMLRNKSISQCGRVAFGYSGIYDEDECQRISDSQKPKLAPTEVVFDLSHTDLTASPSKTPVDEALTLGGYTYTSEDLKAFCARNCEVYDEISILGDLETYVNKMDAEKTEVAHG